MGIVFFIIMLVILAIAFQNYEELSREISLRINLVFAEYKTVGIATGVWFIFFFAVGWVLGYIKGVSAKVQSAFLKRKIANLEKKVKELETQLTTQDRKEEKQKEEEEKLKEIALPPAQSETKT